MLGARPVLGMATLGRTHGSSASTHIAKLSKQYQRLANLVLSRTNTCTNKFR
jgi:hypothetical protein